MDNRDKNNIKQKTEEFLEDLENDDDIEKDEDKEDLEDPEGEDDEEEGKDKEGEEDDEEEGEEDTEGDKDNKKPTKKEPSDKEKFKQSASEAQILLAKNKQLVDTVIKAKELPEPTEEDLKTYATSEGLNFTELTQVEKALLKKSYLSEKKVNMINDTVIESQKVDEWADTVDDFLGNEKTLTDNPVLAGREDEFKSFCMKKNHRGVDFEVLVDAFSHRASKSPKHKGSLLLTGGGEDPKPRKKTMDESDSETLRKSSPKSWNAAVKSKKIKIDY